MFFVLQILSIFFAYNCNASQNKPISSETPDKILNDILKVQRQNLRREMAGFPFPNNKSLDDLTLQKGGEPIRSILITTWRSGSTFFGDAINKIPGNFYHYEPLADYGVRKLRNEPQASEAIRFLSDLLKCDYSDVGAYLRIDKIHTIKFRKNTRFWKHCGNQFYCWEARFYSDFCQQFPFQSMKVVRLGLEVASRLLEDESINVRLVYLVRDPRGTLKSRESRPWCQNQIDCADAATLCQDLESDYQTARDLVRRYPTRFLAIRYEDLSKEPFKMMKNILKFYGLPFDDSVKKYLNTHTKESIGGAISTQRNATAAPFNWITTLQHNQTLRIQESCARAMSMWGYKMIANESQQDNNFDPLLPYSL